MRWYGLLVLTSSLLVHPIHVVGQQDLDIGIKLTKTAVMLGEPAWVDVSVTNRTHEAQYLEFGVACMGLKPLKVQIPAAEPGPKELKRCGQGIGWSCSSGALPSVQPGDTLIRRYVLDGDFQIVRLGSYEVLLEKVVRYAPVSSNRSDLALTASVEKQQTANSTLVLQVDATDSGKLLSLEQEYARTAIERPAVPKFPVYSADGKPNDIVAQMEASMRRDVTAAGLAAYPAAGMETIFRGWVGSHQYNAYGLQALKRLNTAAAREALADIAGSQAQPQDTWVQSFRWQAINALADLGDRKYVPLLEHLIHDSDASIRSAALQGLGRFGSAELDLLAGIARDGNTIDDRLEAIRAIGDTASLKAVPLLIELADIPDADQPATSYIALRELTHLDFPSPAHRPLPEIKSAWRQYWNQHRQTAGAYGPYECGDPPFNPYLGLGGTQ